MDTFIYSRDGSKKVNLSKATLLGDVLSEKNICQQGDNSQLWRSASGSYFKGGCLHHALGTSGIVNCYKFIPISSTEAKQWVINYYGVNELARFGFEDNAQEI